VLRQTARSASARAPPPWRKRLWPGTWREQEERRRIDRDGSTLPVNKKEAEGERRSRSRHHGARGCPSSASPGSSAPDAGAAGTNGSDTGPWRVDESWTDVQLLQERRHRTITPARLESRQGDPVQARDTRRSQL